MNFDPFPGEGRGPVIASEAQRFSKDDGEILPFGRLDPGLCRGTGQLS